jgi:ribosomal protein S18 acetylase RimI-like enzyme
VLRVAQHLAVPIDRPAALPEGFTVRPPTPADAEAILALARAQNERIVGFADCTLDDVRDDLVEPGFDCANDGWLVHDAGGAVVGYAWSFAKGDGPEVDVDVVASDGAVARWLLARAADRGVGMARARGHRAAEVSAGVYRDDATLRAVAAELGFARARTFHRMRIDHGGPRPEPAVLPGVTLRRGPGDEAFARQVHAVETAAFAGHWRTPAPGYELWRERLDAAAMTEWGQVLLAHLGGRPVGALIGNDAFVENERCGHVQRLGVLPEARGRGVAGHLLRRAFADDAAKGREGTLLHVDTDNVTPALRLYEGVGMRAVLVIDAWTRTLAV